VAASAASCISENNESVNNQHGVINGIISALSSGNENSENGAIMA
jgi:hypothetical protein